MKKENLLQIAFVVLLIAVPLAAYYYLEETHFGSRLDIKGPKTENERGETVHHTVAPFSFINQLGDTVTKKDFKNKIYVANFFFASCPTICPTMLTQMMRVRDKYGDEDWFKMISHTVDPRHDTVEVLRAYSRNYSADPENWYFVTGERKELYLHARNSYLTDNLEGDGGKTDFIHSQFVVLVDPNNHIRGFYDGTEPGEVDDLMEDIDSLAEEFEFE